MYEFLDFHLYDLQWDTVSIFSLENVHFFFFVIVNVSTTILLLVWEFHLDVYLVEF